MIPQFQDTSLTDSDEVEAIPATEMKNAHGKRLPDILRRKGVARVTRYKRTDYFVVSPELFKTLTQKAKRSENPKLKVLKRQYQDLLVQMQSADNQNALTALSTATGEKLGAATQVGASD